jgi:hypothetical protein
MLTFPRLNRTLRHAAFTLVAALALLPARAHAENLVTNSNFNTNIANWGFAPPPTGSSKAWDPLDAHGASNSGSGVVINSATTAGIGLGALSQCVNGINGGVSYDVSGSIYIPAGQGRTGDTTVYSYWTTGSNCTGTYIGQGAPGFGFDDLGSWGTGSASAVSPPAARSLWVILAAAKDQAGGSFRAHFDDIVVCRSGQCEGGADGWLTSSEFPDFRFRVQFTPGTGPFYGAKESDCLPDTLCVSSELRGRTAVLLRIIGPRPNGYLWFQATRFPAQQVDIEVQQLSTGVVKTYRLDRLDPDDTQIPGRLDRTAFLP